MFETLFHVVIALSGFFLLNYTKTSGSATLTIAFAWPIGCVIWCVASMLALILQGGAFLAATLFLASAATMLPLWWHSSSISHQTRLIRIATLIATVAFFSLLAQSLRATQGSYDSFEQIAVGRSLLTLGLREDTTTLLASWGILVPAVQGASVLLDKDYLSPAQPLYFLSLLATFYFGGRVVFKQNHVRVSPFLNIALIFGVIFLATTYFLLWQAFYIHNSLPSALYLLMFFTGVFSARRKFNSEALVLSFVGITGFTLCRTEAPLFAGMAVLLGATYLYGTPQFLKFRRYACIYGALVLAWYLSLLFLVGAGSDILTPSRLVAMLSVTLAALGIIATAPVYRLSDLLVRHSPWVVVLGAVALCLVAYFWDSQDFKSNINTIESNMLFFGRWGPAWFVIAGLLAISLATRRSKEFILIFSFTLGFLAFVLFLGLFRENYRIGWGDSANRMITHLLPLLTMGLLLNLGLPESRIPISPTEQSARRKLITAFLSALVITLFFSSFFLIYRLGPQNIAPISTVLQPSGFCQPDEHGEYGFRSALRPSKKYDYAAACTNEKISVLIELPYEAFIQILEFDEYSAEEKWTSFGISTSVDGDVWDRIFDTVVVVPNSAVVQRLRPGGFSIDTSSRSPWRYLRIDFRSSIGQNRLLLRRLGIIELRWRTLFGIEPDPGSRHELVDAVHDLAPESKVLTAEDFCPPDRSGEYGFDMALNPGIRSGYAAACSSGPQRVTIQLPRPSALKRLVFQEYSATEQWQYFSIQGSLSGGPWKNIFNTTTPTENHAILHRISPERFLLHLPNSIEFDQIRIDFESSAGQNRLLLRRLSILEDPVGNR